MAALKLGALIVILTAAPLAAQAPNPAARYRILRYADRATEAWWENWRMEDLTPDEVPCDLPEVEVYTAPGFRIADPDRAGRECQWTAPPDAVIFATMRSDVVYTFTLRTRTSEWEPWSDVAVTEPGEPGQPRTPTGLRIVVP